MLACLHSQYSTAESLRVRGLYIRVVLADVYPAYTDVSSIMIHVHDPCYCLEIVHTILCAPWLLQSVGHVESQRWTVKSAP